MFTAFAARFLVASKAGSYVWFLVLGYLLHIVLSFTASGTWIIVASDISSLWLLISGSYRFWCPNVVSLGTRLL